MKLHLIIALIMFLTFDAFMFASGGKSITSECVNYLYTSLDNALDALHQWWHYG